jgi:hypothetical protein
MAKKRKINDLQNIHIKLKIEYHEPHLKPGMQLMCSRRISSSCSTSCTRRVKCFDTAKLYETARENKRGSTGIYAIDNVAKCYIFMRQGESKTEGQYNEHATDRGTYIHTKARRNQVIQIQKWYRSCNSYLFIAIRILRIAPMDSVVDMGQPCWTNYNYLSIVYYLFW